MKSNTSPSYHLVPIREEYTQKDIGCSVPNKLMLFFANDYSLVFKTTYSVEATMSRGWKSLGRVRTLKTKSEVGFAMHPK
jgi:hypothetical protein